MLREWPEHFKDLALAWLNEQWNVPSRSDYYMMRVAQRIQQQWSKEPVSLKDQIVDAALMKYLNYEARTQKEKAPGPATQEEIERSKAIWMGGVKAYQRVAEERRRGH